MNNLESTQEIKDFLFGVKVPETTTTYKPIPHRKLVELTLESIEKTGLTLKNERYIVAKDGLEASGIYSIGNVMDSEMGLMVAWQSSYNKHLPLKFAVGAEIFVCSNGCVRGDMGNFRRKHMGDVVELTPTIIEDFLKEARQTFNVLIKDKEHLKTVKMDSIDRAALLGDMFFNHSLITPTQLNVVKREIISPTFNYNAEDSAWEVLQHITYAMKEATPATWMRRHHNVHKYFVDKFPYEAAPKMLSWGENQQPASSIFVSQPNALTGTIPSSPSFTTSNSNILDGMVIDI